MLQYTPMYTIWTEALLGTEPDKQRRALLRTTGNTPKRLRDCKSLPVDNAPHGLSSGYKDLCNKGSTDQRTYKTMIKEVVLWTSSCCSSDLPRYNKT
jgi:hypothetical protein